MGPDSRGLTQAKSLLNSAFHSIEHRPSSRCRARWRPRARRAGLGGPVAYPR